MYEKNKKIPKYYSKKYEIIAFDESPTILEMLFTK